MYTLEILLDESRDETIRQYDTLLQLKETSDSGIDLVVSDQVSCKPGSVSTLNFGIKCQMTKNGEPSAYFLFPRSSISKTPLLCANSVGIIDRDYRGNIMGKVRYLPFDLEAKDPYLVDKGTRLFQICSPDLHPIKVKLVDQLTETSRGEGGFGSTGVGLSSSY